MIELTHIATGALAGRRCDGPVEAFVAGVAMHALMDVTPHAEIDDRPFEEASTVAGVLALVSRYGLRSPVVWGAIGGVLPDAEHLVPKRLRRGGRGLFPTHRYRSLHHSGGRFAVPAWVQVLFGGAVIGGLVFAARKLAEPEPQTRWQRARRHLHG